MLRDPDWEPTAALALLGVWEQAMHLHNAYQWPAHAEEGDSKYPNQKKASHQKNIKPTQDI